MSTPSGPPGERAPGLQRLPGGGVSGLAQQLYAETFGLQVTPRRRLRGTSGSISVPATGTANVPVVTPFTLDTMGVRDGVQIDLAFVLATAAAPGLTMQALSVTVDFGQGGGAIALGNLIPNQPLFTNAQVSAFANFAANMTPSPALLTYTDFENLSLGALTDQTGPVQLRLSVAAIVANSSAAAVNVTVQALAWIRFVRGLQEG